MDVTYDGSFWKNTADETPCRPVAVNKQFDWNGYTWFIPAIYVCRQGMVMDLLKRVPLSEMEVFVKKWKDREGDSGHWAAAEYENPLSGNFGLEIRAEGAEIRHTRSCGTCWHPFGDDGRSTSREAQVLMKAYNCSEDYSWNFNRAFFQWDFEAIPENVRLELKLRPEKYMLPCPEHFTVETDSAEKTVEFTHPVTGSRHVLVVRESAREMLTEFEFDDGGRFTYPRCCLRLRYRFENEEEYEQFFPRDCSDGDSPRRNGTAGEGNTLIGTSVAAIAILVGEDSEDRSFEDGSSGDGSSRDSRGRDSGWREAYSALHFEPVDQAEWRIDACVIKGEACEIALDIDMSE